MSYKKVKTGNMKISKSRKTGGSGGGQIALLVIAVVLLVLVIGSTILGMVFCPSRRACKEIVTDFQVACNELEPDGILDCLDPVVANPLRLALGVGSVVTAKSSNEMLEGILDALGGGVKDFTESTGLSIDGIFKSIRIKPVRYGFPGKTRIVLCRASVNGIEQMLNIYISKRFGEVYIKGVSLAKMK